MGQKLVIISLAEGAKRICGYGKVKKWNKELNLYDMSQKMIFCVPGPTDKPIDFHPVFKRGTREWDYCKATVSLDGFDNELTGENVTAYDCVMAIKECWKGDLASGEVAICATPDTINDIKKAIDDGFPASRINYDLMEEVVAPVKKSVNVNDYIAPKEEETQADEVAELGMATSDIKDEDVKGIADIKPVKDKQPKKETKAKVTK